MRQGMFPLTLGRYHARLAAGDPDLAEAQALRALAFATPGPDRDRFDDRCRHVLVREGILDVDRMSPDIPHRDDGELSVMAEFGVASARRALAHAGFKRCLQRLLSKHH